MIRRHTPLQRSTKPLKRSPIQRRRKTRPTDDPAHLDAVRAAGCVVCLNFYGRYRRAEAHHVRDGQGTSMKATDHETAGLCYEHHRTGAFGEAVHNGTQTFQARYGTERQLVARTLELLSTHATGGTT